MSKYTDSAVSKQATLGPFEAIACLLCWFAAFPYAAYTQLATPLSRARVVANGLAVILSPLVFTIALASNGPRLVGNSPYLLLLPVVVFAVDRLLIAMSYHGLGGTGWLLFIRLVILCISLCMAVFAALLTESDNLLRSLYREEDAATMQSEPAQDMATRLKAVQDTIARNEKTLQGREVIENERLDALRLRDLECSGKSGLDPRSNTIIKGGGRCGENARTHEINAEAAQARLDKLKGLETETHGLAGQRNKLRGDYQALLESQRSPSNSVGTLMRALPEADGGILFKIFAIFAMVMTIEGAALALSGVAVTETLQLAVRVSDEVDRIRLQAWRDAELAQLARGRAARRAQAGDGLAPLDVSLTPGPRARTAAQQQPAGQPRGEEVAA